MADFSRVWVHFPLRREISIRASPGPKSACLLVFCTPRRTTIPGVGGLTDHPASPYLAPISVTNNSSDIEGPGGAEINIIRPPGGTGPRVIFPDLAVYAGGPHGRPFCAAGTGRHRGAPSIGTIEGCNKTSGDYPRNYGTPAPVKVHLLRGSLRKLSPCTPFRGA